MIYYAVGSGHDATSLTRFYPSLTKTPPTTQGEGIPVPTLGPVRRRSTGQRTLYNGNLSCVLFWGAMYEAHWNALIAATLGSMYAADALVTLVTRDEDRNWGTWNGYAVKPQAGEDFTRKFGGGVTDLRFRFELERPTITTLTTNTTITSTQRHVRGNTASGNITITLPSAAGTTNVVFAITKYAAANTLSVSGTGVSESLTAINERLHVYSDGAAWNVIE